MTDDQRELMLQMTRLYFRLSLGLLSPEKMATAKQELLDLIERYADSVRIAADREQLLSELHAMVQRIDMEDTTFQRHLRERLRCN